MTAQQFRLERDAETARLYYHLAMQRLAEIGPDVALTPLWRAEEGAAAAARQLLCLCDLLKNRGEREDA